MSGLAAWRTPRRGRLPWSRKLPGSEARLPPFNLSSSASSLFSSIRNLHVQGVRMIGLAACIVSMVKHKRPVLALWGSPCMRQTILSSTHWKVQHKRLMLNNLQEGFCAIWTRGQVCRRVPRHRCELSSICEGESLYLCRQQSAPIGSPSGAAAQELQERAASLQASLHNSESRRQALEAELSELRNDVEHLRAQAAKPPAVPLEMEQRFKEVRPTLTDCAHNQASISSAATVRLQNMFTNKLHARGVKL